MPSHTPTSGVGCCFKSHAVPSHTPTSGVRHQGAPHQICVSAKEASDQPFDWLGVEPRQQRCLPNPSQQPALGQRPAWSRLQLRQVPYHQLISSNPAEIGRNFMSVKRAAAKSSSSEARMTLGLRQTAARPFPKMHHLSMLFGKLCLLVGSPTGQPTHLTQRVQKPLLDTVQSQFPSPYFSKQGMAPSDASAAAAGSAPGLRGGWSAATFKIGGVSFALRNFCHCKPWGFWLILIRQNW